MNYLKTAASACASILVLFSTATSYAGPEVIDKGTQASPEDAARVKAESGSGFQGFTGIINSTTEALGFGGKAAEKAAGGASSGVNGTCPKKYLSTATEIPAAVEVANDGLNCERAAIGQFVDGTVGGSTSRVVGATEIIAAHAEYQKDWDGCQNYQSLAAKVCIADASESLSDGITLINGLLSAGGAASIYDTCTTFGKAMDIGQKALAAYTAACTMARQPCVLFCGDVSTALNKLQTMIKKVGTEGGCEDGSSTVVPSPDTRNALCKTAYGAFNTNKANVLSTIKAELDASNIKSSGGKLSRCDRKYWQNVASAGVGILQLANSLKQGKECQEDSSALAANAAATCEIAANANLPECICLANPRTAGCSNGLSSVGELNAGSGQIVSGKAISPDATVGSLGKDSTGMTQGEKPSGSSSDAGGIGAPTGGGPSLGSVGGGSGAGVGEKGAGSGHGLNTDILSGAGGGGGGGSGGYRGSSSDSGKGLRNYLPGGAKDPKRGLAGQGTGNKEVTGQAGKSNWEKVRDRYIENKNSLIGN